jgi:dihydroxyacetone kinase
MCSLQIAGAMVEKGKSLTDIAQTVRMVLKVLATYGVSLSACSLPGEQSLYVHKFIYKTVLFIKIYLTPIHKLE